MIGEIAEECDQQRAQEHRQPEIGNDRERQRDDRDPRENEE